MKCFSIFPGYLKIISFEREYLLKLPFKLSKIKILKIST